MAPSSVRAPDHKNGAIDEKKWEKDITIRVDDEGGDDREMKKGKKRRGNEMQIPDDGVPYDRGWAWVIVLGGFINFVIAAGYNRGVYIFFVNFLDEFRAPVTETALLFGVRSAINSVVGLFIMNAVLSRLGTRRTVLLGGVCLSLSAILGSFASDVTSLILSQAVFHGLGMAMLNMPATVLLGFYFRRRRSLANSIMKSGVGVGAVAFPAIVTFLLNHYALRGALLLMGSVCLNTIVAAMLFRPPSFYTKRFRPSDGQLEPSSPSGNQQQQQAAGVTSTTQNHDNDDEHGGDGGCGNGGGGVREGKHRGCPTDGSRYTSRENEKLEDGCEETGTKSPDANANRQLTQTVHWEHQLHDLSSPTRGLDRSMVVRMKKTAPGFPGLHCDTAAVSKSAPALNQSLSTDFNGVPRTRTYSEREVESKNDTSDILDNLSRTSMVRYMSAPHLDFDDVCYISPSPSRQQHVASLRLEGSPVRSSICGRGVCAVWRLLKKVFGVLDFSLFQSPMFRLLVLFFVCSPVTNAVSVYLPAMCRERGLDENQRAILLSIIGGLDFFCRLFCGFLADLRIMKVSTIMGVAFFILGVVCQLTRLLTSFSLLIGLAVAQGLLGGVSACLLPILIMEDIGLEHTAKALGFNKLFSGASMAAVHPLLGYIRDTTGSYDAAYSMIGAFTILSAVIIVCIRFLPHRLGRETEQEHTSMEEESAPLKPTNGMSST